MYKEIGAFDAKARLSELLRAVSEGQRFTISIRGKPVADLIPSQASGQEGLREALEALRNIPKVTGVSDDEVRDMIREGRK
ncbi:type II toxin-antitoxin system Phd/YefM family antitoxin [Pseudoduganella sp. OTU4001]|uniref:type II toxin-antitoxin system Phd/YefM family antitoxin n=1 Tax=Pseudoduganella sp. OTU4001 TaxID=3043854 RepID=UPI00313AB3BD